MTTSNPGNLDQTQLDEQIAASLRREAEHYQQELGKDPSVLDLVSDTFHSRMRLLVVMVIIATLAYCGLMVFCAWQFFAATSTQAQIGWATGFLASLLAVVAFKMWYWMELQKSAILREIKRAELRLMLAVQADVEHASR